MAPAASKTLAAMARLVFPMTNSYLSVVCLAPIIGANGPGKVVQIATGNGRIADASCIATADAALERCRRALSRVKASRMELTRATLVGR